MHRKETPTTKIFLRLKEHKKKVLQNIKVSLEMKVKFKKENEEGEIQYIKNYFREDHPEVFSKNDDENKIKGDSEDIFEKINNNIDQWVKEGSGWEVGRIELVYVNIARSQPLRKGTYLPLPEKLKKQESDYQRAKQGQRMFEVGAQVSFVSPTGTYEDKQTKFLSGQRRY